MKREPEIPKINAITHGKDFTIELLNNVYQVEKEADEPNLPYLLGTFSGIGMTAIYGLPMSKEDRDELYSYTLEIAEKAIREITKKALEELK